MNETAVTTEVAVAECNDPQVSFFQDVPGNSPVAVNVTGPPGQFTADVRFRNGATGVSGPLPPTLPPSPNAHVITVVILFVAACTVKVEANIGGQAYCTQISGTAGQTANVALIISMHQP